MLESGNKTKSKVLGFISGLMEVDMRASMWMEKEMEKDSWFMQMETNTMENG